MFGISIAKLAGIAIIILGLFSGMMYYRSEALSERVDKIKAQDKVAVLKGESATLKKHISSITQKANNYIDALGTMSESNIELTKQLQSARTKLAKHNLLKLRNSAHSELVLKTINKSVARMNKEWMATQ